MDRCYYTHNGRTCGPVPRATLSQLATVGNLSADDLVWGEGEAPTAAVAAQAIVVFARPAAASSAPDWLADVARAEEVHPRTSPAPHSVALAPELAAAPPSPGLEVEELPPLLPPSDGACRVSVGCATSRGRVCKRNEDHFLVQQQVWSDGEDVHEATLLVVADGISGEKPSDRASALVVSTLATIVSPALAGLLLNRPHEVGTGVLAQAVGKAVREANLAVSRLAEEETGSKDVWFDGPRRRQTGSQLPDSRSLGSTAAIVAIRDGKAVISHVGDCRVYHQRGDTLTQVTRDHTLVAHLVESGKLTPEEAAGHPAGNQVTQALGWNAPLQPSRQEWDLERGDWIILACGGLATHVTEDVLTQTVQQAAPSAGYLAKRLVELANEDGGTDNCTIVAAYCY